MKERSLVAFTILSQMAVGAVWMLSTLHGWAERQAGFATADTLTRPAILAIGPVACLALLASFLHLGTPANAWRAFANLRSSWLSREILAATLFTGASLLLSGLYGFDIGTPGARSVVGWVTALLGLNLILSMALAYELRTVPAWNTSSTPTQFAITALLLGGLAVGTRLIFNPGASQELLRTVAQWTAWQTVLLLGMELSFIPLWMADLASGSEAARAALTRITQEHDRMFRLRLALAGLGMLFAGFALSPWWQWTSARLGLVLACVSVLIAEVLGRVLFYEARVRDGV